MCNIDSSRESVWLQWQMVLKLLHVFFWILKYIKYFKKDRHLTSQAHSSHSTLLFFCIKIILYPNYYIVIFCIGKKHHFNMVTFCSHLLGVSVSRFWKNKRNGWVLFHQVGTTWIHAIIREKVLEIPGSDT